MNRSMIEMYRIYLNVCVCLSAIQPFMKTKWLYSGIAIKTSESANMVILIVYWMFDVYTSSPACSTKNEDPYIKGE